MTLLGRMVWIAVAFLLSASLALVLLVTIGGLWIGDQYAAEMTAEYGDPAASVAAPLIGILLFTGAVGPALTSLPGLAAVIVGEVLGIRSWLYYVLAGGAAVAVIPWLVGRNAGGMPEAPATEYMTIFASAGFAAGFLYWLLAGRHA